MKKLLVFIVLLFSNIKAQACTFYPDGNEMRFSIFNVSSGLFRDYNAFFYTSNYFSYQDDTEVTEFAIKSNVFLWQEYCKFKVDTLSIRNAIYNINVADIKANTKNEMIKYLFKNNDIEAINYLIFAKSNEFYNAFQDDPWERGGDWAANKRNAHINKALRAAIECKNEKIRIRYYFQLMRLGFYNQDSVLVQNVYDKYLAHRNLSSVMDYWCLYFLAAVQTDPIKKSFYAAQVFYNAPDKRKNAVQMVSNSVDINDVLKLARTSKQKAAIIATYAIQKLDFSLSQIQQLYKLDPDSDALGFLLLREINKLEDWIYTPYYCCFGPEFRDIEAYKSSTLKAQRIAEDRTKAAQLLAFINTVHLNEVKKPELFIAAKAYLLLMVQDYARCEEYCRGVLSGLKSAPVFADNVKMIQALCITANQQKGAAILKDNVKEIVAKQYNENNKRFVFAIARQLEFLGNTAIAGLLYTKLDSLVYGAKQKAKHTYASWMYYDNYFFYLDDIYTASQTKGVIAEAQKGAADAFSKWLIADVDYERLYELLGTKYIRENKLYPALAAFNKVKDKAIGSEWLDNPFYKFNHTEDFVPRHDSITKTKAGITAYLIKCINKASDVNEKNRAYYAFLAGNCYFNMSQYGNSWYMRRFSWTSEPVVSVKYDDKEFFSNSLAQFYYMQAFKLAKTRKLRALSLRMAAHCKHEELIFQYTAGDFYSRYGNTDFYDRALRNNVYTQKFKKLYPDYVDYLFGACDRYSEYFKV